MRLAEMAAILVALSVLAACGQAPTTAETTEFPPAGPTESVQFEAYEGKWAVDAAGCDIEQDQQGSPYLFHNDGFEQHEAHCTWTYVRNVGPNAWSIDAACQVEGDEQSLHWDISVDGDTMQMNPGGPLVRCPL